MGTKTMTLGLAAAAAAFSWTSTQADAASCVPTNNFGEYFAGGSNANCSIGNATILGNAWNPTAQAAGLETLQFFTTPSNNPGVQFFINTILSAANGASFTFTVSTPAASPMYALSFSPDTSSTVANFTVMANSQTESVIGDGTLNFAVGPTNSITITTTVTDAETAGALSSPTYKFSQAAVPEPSSLVLIGVGLSALGLAQPRARKRAGR